MKILGKNQHVTTVRAVYDSSIDQVVMEVVTTMRKIVKMKVDGRPYRYANIATGVQHTTQYEIPDFGLVPDYVFIRKIRQFKRSVRKAHCMRVRRDRRED
ncbi:hypothetical protein Stm18_027 [Stenotrophomonas phage Stm18]